MSPLDVLSIVFPVFCIIGLGYVLAVFKKVELEPIIDLLLYVTIPALVVSSLSKKPFAASELGIVSLSAVSVVIGTGAIALAYLTLTGQRALKGFYLPVMFMNAGNMSFPLAVLAFGPDGLMIAVLFYIVMGLLVYSLGIFIAKGKGGFAEMFRLPLIYAASLGIGLNLGGIKLPGPVLNTLDMLGAATIPMMQISLGYRLASARFSHLGISVTGSVIRIIGGAAIAYAVVNLLGIEGVTRKVIILSSGMPSAVINFVVSQKYKLDSELVASMVVTSTVISIVSTPILLMWLMG